jgi:DNA-binding CsgD family transcriptional regulator
MKFLNTEMYMVTFWITAFEIIMLFFQVVHYLQRTSDKKRLFYLILLVMMITHNMCSGFMPDKNIPISIVTQNIIAFLGGFTMSMYFVYYFYRTFELDRLRFFALYGSLLFLIAPFVLLFVLPYVITGRLTMARQLTVVVPFFYGVSFVYATTRAFIHKFKKQRLNKQKAYPREMVVAAYIALLCWVTLPVIVFFGDFQVLQHSVTNSGFLMMTIIYVRSSIVQARQEYEQLQATIHTVEDLVDFNYKRFGFTPREIEVTEQLMKGIPYKLIAHQLNISEKTINRHVSNAFAKTGATNKVELIKKLETREYA